MKDKKRKKLYSEKEIGLLIKRATELHEKVSEHPDHGLSLEEIEHIAREIGIEPEYLQTAAKELEIEMDIANDSYLWGGPFVFNQKRIVEGTVNEEQWGDIVQKLRRMTGSAGKTSTIGQTREWMRSIDIFERTHVSLNSRENQTAIEVRKNFRGGALMAYLVGLIFSVSAAGIFLDGSGLSDLMHAIVIGGSSFGGILAVRAALVSWSRRQKHKFNKLIDWLQETVSTIEPAETSEEPFIGIPENAEDKHRESTDPGSGRRIKT